MTTELENVQEKETGRRLSAPIGVLRDQLRSDDQTQEIAAALGLDVETYVEEVLRFAANPDVDPELGFLEDEVLEAEGVDVPSEQALLEWFAAAERGQTGGEPGTANLADGYGDTAEEAKRRALQAAFDAVAALRAPSIDEPRGEVIAKRGEPRGSVLEEQVSRRLMDRDLHDRRARAAARKLRPAAKSRDG